MQTLRYEEIEGLRVITGFDELQKDPVETKKVVVEATELTEEHFNYVKAQEGLATEYARLRMIMDQRARRPYFKGPAKITSPELEELKESSEVARAAFVLRLARCYEENPVHFEPRTRELVPDDVSALKSKYKTLAANERLTVAGDVTVDFRGVQYYENGSEGWQLQSVDTFNTPLPDGAILPVDMSVDQQNQVVRDANRRRIKSLSASERYEEKRRQLDGVAIAAATKRSVEEIKGMSALDALESAQSYHRMLKQEIENTYR